jgi:hypothetical protein
MPVPKNRKSPHIGSKYTKIYKGETYHMTVVKTPSGIGFKVKNNIYRSPSAAAKSITNKEVNGWVFWYIENKNS